MYRVDTTRNRSLTELNSTSGSDVVLELSSFESLVWSFEDGIDDEDDDNEEEDVDLVLSLISAGSSHKHTCLC